MDTHLNYYNERTDPFYWYENLSQPERQRLRDYLGFDVEANNMPWPLIRCALASVADMAIIPMQDVLGLGEGNRMNLPGTINNNWHWRFQWAQLPTTLAAQLHHLNVLYGRCEHVG